jgi:hypothetical protein
MDGREDGRKDGRKEGRKVLNMMCVEGHECFPGI